MSYRDALEAAGANVLEMRYFGSYQGDWFAVVEHNGKRGLVSGAFGSCTVCDAFDAEFDSYYGDEKESEEDYNKRLAEFGSEYLSDLRNTNELIEDFKRQAEWDSDAESVVLFLENVQKNYGV